MQKTKQATKWAKHKGEVTQAQLAHVLFAEGNATRVGSLLTVATEGAALEAAGSFSSPLLSCQEVHALVSIFLHKDQWYSADEEVEQGYGCYMAKRLLRKPTNCSKMHGRTFDALFRGTFVLKS